MEIAFGEAKMNIAPASCSLQILSKSEITKIYSLICLQLLFKACWRFGTEGMIQRQESQMKMRMRMMSCSPIAAQVHAWSLGAESQNHQLTEPRNGLGGKGP